MEGIALLVAGCSAAGFGLSTSLQHLAADGSPTTARRTHELLGYLARRPSWLLGQVVALASFLLHALALRLGALVLVQPVVVSGIVLAVPMRAALARRWPTGGELGTVLLTAAGLGLLIVAGRPTAGGPPGDPGPAVALVAAGAAVALAAAGWAGRCRVPERAAFGFGVGAGVLFGLVAGLVKLTGDAVAEAATPIQVLAAWPAWAALAVGLTAVGLNQRAYRVARLSASMPALNVVDVLVALVFGYVVFGEVPAHSPAAVAAQLVAAACIVTGLLRLGRVGEPP